MTERDSRSECRGEARCGNKEHNSWKAEQRKNLDDDHFKRGRNRRDIKTTEL